MPIQENTHPMWLRLIDGTPWLVYMITSGDTLSDIAQRHTGDSEHWHVLQEINKIEDVAKIQDGQVIKIRPVPPEEFKMMIHACEKAITEGNISLFGVLKDAVFGQLSVHYENSAVVVGKK